MPLPSPAARVALPLALLLNLAAGPVHAEQPLELPAETVADALALARDAARALAPDGARVEAEAGALDSRLKLAPCQRIQTFVPAGVNPWGRSRVGLRCVQGPVAWQVQLPVTVRVWAKAVVSPQPLPVGARLDPAELQLSETDWAALPGRPFASAAELSDRVLARPVQPGAPVRPGDLKPRQWFASGETVQVVAQGRGFSIQTEGQAMAPGVEGQPVRVRTETGAVVVGQPVGQRRVELAL